jgi:hypothetical protein
MRNDLGPDSTLPSFFEKIIAAGLWKEEIVIYAII